MQCQDVDDTCGVKSFYENGEETTPCMLSPYDSGGRVWNWQRRCPGRVGWLREMRGAHLSASAKLAFDMILDDVRGNAWMNPAGEGFDAYLLLEECWWLCSDDDDHRRMLEE